MEKSDKNLVQLLVIEILPGSQFIILKLNYSLWLPKGLAYINKIPRISII